MLFWKKKIKTQILTEEDINKLKEMERKAYLEEAEKLVLLRGKDRAKKELSVKEEKERWLQI